MDTLSALDVEPIVDFLVKKGVPERSINIDIPVSALSQLAQSVQASVESGELNFGDDVAEKDSALRRYFVETDAFRAVRLGRRQLVVGPKGSGKTAIVQQLKSIEANSILITPEHYAIDMLATTKKEPIGGNPLQPYITAWKYTLLIEVFRTVVQQNLATAKALAEIRKFLVDKQLLSADRTIFERFMDYLRRITSIKAGVEVTLAESRNEELARLFKMDDVLRFVPKVNTILTNKKLSVFVDELDQSWDNSRDANEFLIGLVMAAIELSSTLVNAHVVVFIRSEVFDLLTPHLAHLDKLRMRTEFLQWSETDLVKMITDRALFSFKMTGVRPSDVAATLFADRMSGGGCTGLQYLMSRTSFRPRELIQFSGLALRHATRLGHPNISEAAILRAEEEFSKWKYEYVVAEHLYIYPAFGQWVLSHLRGKQRQMTRDQLDTELLKILDKSQAETDAPDWLAKCQRDPEELLKILYKTEVLGIERVGDTAIDTRRPWEAYDFYYTRPDPTFDGSPGFLFHPALWKHLQLV